MLVALFACNCQGPGPESQHSDSDGASPWEAQLEDLDGVLLSVWGTSSSNIWVTGADGGDGPEVHHFDGTDWIREETGDTGHLWWVFGTGDQIWFVGEAGRVLRRDSSGTYTSLVSPSQATLYGAWGASEDLIYSVGGFVDGDGGPVLLAIEGDTVSEVEGLPSGIGDDEVFFKVWGSAEDDVWVISQSGTVLHFDGSEWSRTLLPDEPRLVTVHGSSEDDLVIVGGSSQGVIFERRDGAAWAEVEPTGTQPLMGVFLEDSQRGVASGMRGQVVERLDGTWSAVQGPRLIADWHGAWIDDTGRLWLAGGNFMHLSEGTLYVRED
ncbi:MAG TPA: hypothetical protein QGF58_26545 [Myxococcota bacterium]|nr:hypothetical protein [Myxococcota bacterium]